MSPADSSPLPLRKRLFAAPPQLFPGRAARTETSGSQSVFSTGWYLQEGLGRLFRTHCSAALASLECMTLQHCLKGTFPPEVRLGLCSYPVRACLWEIPLDTRQEGSWAPQSWLHPLSLPPIHPLFFGRTWGKWKICAQVKEDVMSLR